MNKLKFALLNITGLIFYPQISKGGTPLPYYGPDQQNCRINQPKSEEMMKIDSGFIPSEDCSYIYILPPKQGEILVTSTSANRRVKSDCKVYNKKIDEFNENYPSSNDPDVEAKIRKHERNKKLFIKGFKDSYGDSKVGKASSNAGFRWNELIAEYKKMNPESNAQFKAIPIIQGMLSMKLADRDSTLNNNGIKIFINGYDPKQDDVTDTQNEYKFITMDSATFLMGEKTTIDMLMDFENACNIIENSETVSATYTYIFAVQSKGVVKIRPNIAAIKTAFKNQIEKNKKEITSDEMNSELIRNNAFEIVVNNGMFASQEDKTIIDDFKKDLMSKATEIALSSLANQQAIALKKAEHWKPLQHTAVTQSRALGIKVGEMSTTWTTYVKEIDWEIFESELTENLRLPELSSSNYTQFNLFNTSALNGKTNEK